ncbi:hypothetical protein ACE1SV_44170 [Streptomyces sp. E-15]
MTGTGDRPSAAAWRNLLVATAGFALTFWAWNLIAPLAADFDDRLHMGASAQSLPVAVPVLVGSLGRVPVGALTDRYGAGLMFPPTSALTLIPVLLLIPAKASYPVLLLVGFFLGLGGTTFAIGVPLVTSWFPPSPGARRSASSAWAWAEWPSPATSPRACTTGARTCRSWSSRSPSPRTPCWPRS